MEEPKRREHPDHEEIPLGEIYDPDNPKYQGQSYGNQGINTTEKESIDYELKNNCKHSHLP